MRPSCGLSCFVIGLPGALLPPHHAAAPGLGQCPGATGAGKLLALPDRHQDALRAVRRWRVSVSAILHHHRTDKDRRAFVADVKRHRTGSECLLHPGEQQLGVDGDSRDVVFRDARDHVRGNTASTRVNSAVDSPVLTTAEPFKRTVLSVARRVVALRAATNAAAGRPGQRSLDRRSPDTLGSWWHNARPLPLSRRCRHARQRPRRSGRSG